MGVYQYTLRADTKQVGHLEIAHYQFAYKLSYWGDKAYERMADTYSRHAENAAWKLKHVRYVVQGQWSYAEDEAGLPIFEMPGGPVAEFTEELRHRRIVGVLHKVGRKYYVRQPHGWMLARNAELDKAA